MAKNPRTPGKNRELASPNPAEAGHAAAATPKASAGQEVSGAPRGNPQAPGQQSQGDYQDLPADLDGMHNDSWNPPVQAAGSVEEAAQAAEQAARRAGGHADRLFTGSPGEEGPAPNIPSTLNMDRDATAARTGHEVLQERLREHTATSPALTGGDIDADWASANSVGDESPAGDNPTPDQDIVEEVGHAIGVDYEDGEELKGASKIEERDRHRWELDPASSEDYDERSRERKRGE